MGANPWVMLPEKPPYILPQDRAALERYGISTQALRLDLELLPVPWLGSLASASVVLLSLNPSLGPVLEESGSDYQKAYLENLKFNTKPPFFCLGERFHRTEGQAYWLRLLRSLVNSFGIDQVSRRIMCIEYFPYRSATYVDPRCVLPSQRFSWALASQAVRDGKVVVVQRSWKEWVSAVPELSDYPCIRLRNVRRPFLSQGNMSAADWRRLVSALSVRYDYGRPARVGGPVGAVAPGTRPTRGNKLLKPKASKATLPADVANALRKGTHGRVVAEAGNCTIQMHNGLYYIVQGNQVVQICPARENGYPEPPCGGRWHWWVQRCGSSKPWLSPR